jgi:hypothetical protein
MNNFTFNFLIEKGNKITQKLTHVVVLFLLMTWGVNAATITAVSSSAWGTASTWSNGTVPTNGDTVIIPSGFTVTISSSVNKTVNLIIETGGTISGTSSVSISSLTVQSGATYSCSGNLTITGITDISGTLSLNSTSSRADNFGDFYLQNGSSYVDGTGNRTVTFSGSFINNSTSFNVANSGLRTFSGSGKTISGTTATTFPNVAITATTPGTTISIGAVLSISSALTGTGILVNQGILNIGGTSTLTTLTASPAINTVNYNGVAAQTVMPIAYVNLGLSNSGTTTVAKSIGTGTTVSGVFSISGSATATIATGMNITVSSLLLASVGQSPGTYGSTASTATNTNNTYFTSSATGIVTVTITPLANQDFDMTQFSYSPNPVNNVLNLSYYQDMNSVKVYNMVGQELMTKQVNANTAQIDLSNFANGAYFIQVTTGSAMKTVRVIKR